MAQTKLSTGWPAKLETFRVEDWPGDDAAALVDCTEGQAVMWRQVFAFRRFASARFEWAREHGNASLLQLFRERKAVERRLLGGDG
ncbi:MAG: hypothetical protein ACR2ME_09930 [Acidimicrobiia bacterium]